MSRQLGDMHARALLTRFLAEHLGELISLIFNACAEQGEPLTERHRKILTAAAVSVIRSDCL